MDTRSQRLRRAAAAAPAAVATLYAATGTGLVAVTADQPPGVVPPLLVASALFTVLAVLLLRVAQRWVWIAGAALQVLLILMYLLVAADRTPAFEAWGIAVKLLQIGLLAAFGALVVDAGRGAARPEGRLP
jgi:hypothetical protein